MWPPVCRTGKHSVALRACQYNARLLIYKLIVDMFTCFIEEVFRLACSTTFIFINPGFTSPSDRNNNPYYCVWYYGFLVTSMNLLRHQDMLICCTHHWVIHCRWGRTPLDDAVMFGHEEVADFLRRHISENEALVIWIISMSGHRLEKYCQRFCLALVWSTLSYLFKQKANKLCSHTHVIVV